MEKEFFAYVSRMKNIYRWGLMRNTRRESLCEHSFEVALLAHALAQINKTRFGADCDPDRCAAVALFHDTTEILTGDMPTPVKYYNPEIKEAYKKVEAVAENKLLGMLPADLREHYKGYYNPDSQTHQIVKAADRLSALIKCIEEGSFGNREFTSAEKSIEKSLRELCLPYVNVFLDEFLPAYRLTLDEQSI